MLQQVDNNYTKLLFFIREQKQIHTTCLFKLIFIPKIP